MGSIMATVDKSIKSREQVLHEAKEFINQFYASTKRFKNFT
jgi:hypothetical protein